MMKQIRVVNYKAMLSITAEGGSRTRTPFGHYPLKIARLPIPPLRQIIKNLAHKG